MSALDHLQASPALFALLCAGLGLLVGSFLNVVIYRLPLMMQQEWMLEVAEGLGDGEASEHHGTRRFNLFVPGSACPSCGRPVGVLENVPVASYLALGGRCRGCGSRIPARYPVIEILGGLVALWSAVHFGFGVQAAGAMVLGWSLLALSVIDLDTQLLPDAITLPLLWLGLLLNLGAVYVPLPQAVLGAAAGYLSLWVVYQAFKLLTGKEGMGYGDFKLLAMLGAWMGWKSLLLIVLLSSFAGAVVGIALIALRSHERSTPIPFGPYLAAGGWIAMVWGEPILVWYGGLFGGAR